MNGTNVLAFHAVNSNSTASSNTNQLDFLVEPVLTATRATGADVPAPTWPAPTPGDDNGVGTLGFVEDTQFSVDRGFYTQRSVGRNHDGHAGRDHSLHDRRQRADAHQRHDLQRPDQHRRDDHAARGRVQNGLHADERRHADVYLPGRCDPAERRRCHAALRDVGPRQGRQRIRPRATTSTTNPTGRWIRTSSPAMRRRVKNRAEVRFRRCRS